MTDVSFVRQIAEHHRTKLLDRDSKVNDPTFSSGVAWAIHALDKIVRACDGETDPIELGLKEKLPSMAVQEALFRAEVSAIRRCVRCARRAYAQMQGNSGKGLRRSRLCGECLRWAVDNGHIREPVRNFHTRDELMDEWVMLCGEGYTRVQAAERLGMKPKSFIRAHERARAAGDPRALLDVSQRQWRARKG